MEQGYISQSTQPAPEDACEIKVLVAYQELSLGYARLLLNFLIKRVFIVFDFNYLSFFLFDNRKVLYFRKFY